LPVVPVSKEELELLIATVLDARLTGEYTIDEAAMLADLHLRLEENLETWINGGEIELPITKRQAALGVTSHVRVYEPHEEDHGRMDINKADNPG